MRRFPLVSIAVLLILASAVQASPVSAPLKDLQRQADKLEAKLGLPAGPSDLPVLPAPLEAVDPLWSSTLVLLPGGTIDPVRAGNDRNDGEAYFAIGDSITSSRTLDVAAFAGVGAMAALEPKRFLGTVATDADKDALELPSALLETNLPNGESTYLNLMRDLHDPLASADHSMSGSGQGTWWGRDHVGRYLEGATGQQTFVVLLGNNDPLKGVSPAQTARNLAAIHAEVQAAGARGVWCNLVVPAEGSRWDQDFEARVAAIDAAAREAGAIAVPFYDALDVDPYNGQVDAQDPQYFRDDIHPNRLGQLRMAEMLWAYVGH